LKHGSQIIDCDTNLRTSTYAHPALNKRYGSVDAGATHSHFKSFDHDDATVAADKTNALTVMTTVKNKKFE
jgi:hypothetical protein